MFTGLIEAVGTVRHLRRSGAAAQLGITVTWPDQELPAPGASVAVNGACLTVLEPDSTGFVADLSPETLARTLLGRLRPGEQVNLERALRLGDRLGGHLVQGHVDTVITLLSISNQDGCARWRLLLPARYARQVTDKGSVTIHGVSLTVAELGEAWLEVSLIPETLRATMLGTVHRGTELHLETDILGKYVERMLVGSTTSTAIADFLAAETGSSRHGAR